MISMIDGLPAAGRPALPFAGSPGLNFSEDFKCLNGVVHKTRPIRFVKRCQQWAQSIHQALCLIGPRSAPEPFVDLPVDALRTPHVLDDRLEFRRHSNTKFGELVLGHAPTYGRNGKSLKWSQNQAYPAKNAAFCDQITGTKRLKSPVICARLLLGGRNRWALFRKHG